MKKWPEITFALLCILLCASLSLGMLAFGPAEAAANERLANKPKLIQKEKWNPDFLSDLAKYVGDRFFLRQELITARSRASARLGSSTAEDVILGKRGWLYYAPTLADYCGTDGLSDEELAAIAHNLALMQEYCESIGAQFLFVSAPNKNTLYPEAMPGYRAAAVHDIHRLFPLLEAAGVPYADLYAAFGQQPEILYFAHDSHWNSRGAALAADVINASFGRGSDYFAQPFDGEEAHRGDLYEMLYPAAEDPETDPVSSRGFRYTRKGSDTRPDSITIQTSGEGDGTLLAFRDSFGNSLYPYLADSFAEARFSRLTAYDLLLAEEMGADCVLVELVERNLVYLLQNVPVMPAPERPLPEPAAIAGEVRLERVQGGRAPEGCILVRGTLEESMGGLPVYLSAGNRCWEAFRLEEGGFAAYLPADALPDMLWLQGKQTATAFAVTAVS
jgi:hypothetical protein